MDNDFKLKNGSGCLCCRGCGRQDNKLNTYDWLSDIPGNAEEQDMVEVQFKNTRKGYYKNSNHLALEKGDIVAVEATPGHDIGTVTLTGRLVLLQVKKANLKPDAEIKRIYRKAKPVDLEKYEEAKSREHDTMIRSRKIAEDLGLQMKIGDVEYQGDGNKAIFYYIADERVDFRQLIKVLAEAFHVRIEMKQIGARQEAGRIGGIGPCGRELCCATWMKNFVSVSTSAARFQDISLNPQKLAGQCAKLKCCLNYEVDAYVECLKRLPSKEITLETLDNTYYFFKADILGGKITYSTDKSFLANEATISSRRAFEVINMNKRGEKPEKLEDGNAVVEDPSSKDLVEQESLTRFDKSKNKKKKNKGNPNAQQAAKPNGDKNKNVRNGKTEEKGGDNQTAKSRVNGEERGNRQNEEERTNRQNGEERNNQQRQNRNNRGNRNNRRINTNGQSDQQQNSNYAESENNEPREQRNNQREQRNGQREPREQRNEQRGARNEQRRDERKQRPERRPKPEQRNNGEQRNNEPNLEYKENNKVQQDNSSNERHSPNKGGKNLNEKGNPNSNEKNNKRSETSSNLNTKGNRNDNEKGKENGNKGVNNHAVPNSNIPNSTPTSNTSEKKE